MPAITWVGVDVAKDSLDLAYASGMGIERRSVANERSGHGMLIESLPPQLEARIVVDATGGYERALVTALVEAGYRVAVVNPRQVRDFAKALGILAKTDRIDALVLARFGEQVHRVCWKKIRQLGEVPTVHEPSLVRT
jgi:transposase